MAAAPSDDALKAALAANRANARSLLGDSVSRETWGRLDQFVEMLIRRQTMLNLIAPSTVPQIWTRHIADSLQLLPLAPDAPTWVDLGAGAGFPGLVIACALADMAGAQVHLVEGRQKKEAFLRDVAAVLSLPAIVHAARIEDFVVDNSERFDVLTARALAPLDKLLTYVNPLLKRGAVGLFPKGQDVVAELTQASKSWNIDAELVPSKTDPHGRIVIVRRAKRC